MEEASFAPDNDYTIEAIQICFTGILQGMCTKSLFSSQLTGKKSR